jgi:hypothetical protein
MTRPGNIADDELIRVLGEVLDEDEPIPAGAVEFASQAFTWRDVNSELAELLHDSLLELVEVRDGAAARMLVFQAGAFTLDVEHDHGALRGAVSPPGSYRIEVQEGSGRRPGWAGAVATDETGMFEILGPVDGVIRIAVVVDGTAHAILVTPWITA